MKRSKFKTNVSNKALPDRNPLIVKVRCDRFGQFFHIESVFQGKKKNHTHILETTYRFLALVCYQPNR